MPEHSGCEIRLNQLDRDMERLRHEILGNGQPGKLDRMEARNIAAMTEFTNKLSVIENKLGRVMIIIAVLGAAVGGGTTKLVTTLIGGI
jgi:hypothetical protein